MTTGSERPAAGEVVEPGRENRARARVGRADRFDHPTQWSNRPDDAERERLAGTLGVLLRQLRAERSLSIRDLAARAAVHRSSIERLETGRRRPRPSMLAALAFGLDPAEPGPLRERLVDAAGDSLRPETRAGLRARARRVAAAQAAVNRPSHAIVQTINESRRVSLRIGSVELGRVNLPPAKTNPTMAELDVEEAALNRMCQVVSAYRAADALAERLVDQARAAITEGHAFDARPWQKIAVDNGVPIPRRRRGRRV